MTALRELLASLVALGPLGLFLGAFVDGAGVPVPSGVDVLLVAVASRMPDSVLWLTTVTVVGSVLGNLVLFIIARRGGQMFLERRTRSTRSRKFRGWFDRYGLLTVFVSALVPLPVMPMKIFVFCSGALGVPTSRFVLVFMGARIPRYLALALLGRQMGSDAMGYVRANAWYLGAFALALFLGLMLLMRLAERRRATAE